MDEPTWIVPSARRRAILNEQLANLAHAIRMGGILPTLVAESPDLERQKADLRGRIERLRGDGRAFQRRGRQQVRRQGSAAVRKLAGVAPRKVRERAAVTSQTPIGADQIHEGGRRLEFVARCSLAKLAEGEKHPMRWWPQRGSNRISPVPFRAVWRRDRLRSLTARLRRRCRSQAAGSSRILGATRTLVISEATQGNRCGQD